LYSAQAGLLAKIFSLHRGGPMLSSEARQATRILVAFFCLVVPRRQLLRVRRPHSGAGGDPTGALLAGVKVTVTNEATGVAQGAITNESGDYAFLQVAVGAYRVEFDQAGFKKNLQRGVTVDLNQVVTLNMMMQIGEAKETVEVTSEAPWWTPPVRSSAPSWISARYRPCRLNSRDTYQLLQLQPGVQGVGGLRPFLRQ